MARLETIRGDLGDHFDPHRADREYADAFRKIGVDFDTMDPKRVGTMLAEGQASMEIAAALDQWCGIRRTRVASGPEDTRWLALMGAARIADPDDFRNTLRELYRLPPADLTKELNRLAADPVRLKSQPSVSLLLLASMLRIAGERDNARKVLQTAWRDSPDDFWVNLALNGIWFPTIRGRLTGDLSKCEGFSTAAVASVRAARSRTAISARCCERPATWTARSQNCASAATGPELR